MKPSYDFSVPLLKPLSYNISGDSFGELALLKSTTRAATVVCLEKTEFFVVDHDAFFR